MLSNTKQVRAVLAQEFNMKRNMADNSWTNRCADANLRRPCC